MNAARRVLCYLKGTAGCGILFLAENDPQLELGNRLCRVGFVFVFNLNELKISRLEPNPFIKRVEKS